MHGTQHTHGFTKKDCYSTRDARLHSMAAHPIRSQIMFKSTVKDCKEFTSQIPLNPALLVLLSTRHCSQDSRECNFLPSCPNWMIQLSLDSWKNKEYKYKVVH